MNAVFSKATAFGCSTFLFARDGEILFGKNTDTPFEGEYKRLLLVNKRDCRKEPLKYPGIPTRPWTSKYGSVTLTLFGKEFPEGGMNEAGLVLMPMTLTETEYPPVGKTPRLALGQWKQYVLDSFGSVGEVVDALDGMAPLGYTSHFLVADSSGDCAAIEYLGGKAVCYRGDSLPVPAMTNSRYDASLECLKQHADGSEPSNVGFANGSLLRFVRIARKLNDFEAARETLPVRYCFSILESVSQGEHTKHSVVFDIVERRIYFHTLGCRNIRSISFDGLDFSPDSPVLMLDVNAEGEGDISTRFVPLTAEANQAVAADVCRVALEAVSGSTEMPLLGMTFAEMVEQISHFSCASVADW
jgi:choloylglycine hydrolase